MVLMIKAMISRGPCFSADLQSSYSSCCLLRYGLVPSFPIFRGLPNQQRNMRLNPANNNRDIKIKNVIDLNNSRQCLKNF